MISFQHCGISLVRKDSKEDTDAEYTAPGGCGSRPAHTLGDERDAVGGDCGTDVYTAVAHTADGSGSADLRESAGQTGDE